MKNDDASLKLSLVRFQLAEMHKLGKISSAEFESAITAINKKEQELINELYMDTDFAPQTSKLFMEAIDELKAEQKLPKGLVEKLTLSYSEKVARSRSVKAKPEVYTEKKTSEATSKPEEGPAIELEADQPEDAEKSPADIVGDMTAPDLEVDIEDESTEEKEEERYAGFGSILSAFLQERSIRWGEIIAALIMVGFAIPLSITVWRETGRIGKYLIFLLITMVVFGAGWYVFSRLKLAITGKIMLVIPLLLLPLHFLTIALMQFHVFINIIVIVALGAVGYLISMLIIKEGKIVFILVYLFLCAFHLTAKGFSSVGSIMGFLLVGIAWLDLAGGVFLLCQPILKRELIERKDTDKIYLILGALSYAFVLFFIRTLFAFSPDITLVKFSLVLFLFALPGLYCGYQLLTKKTVDGYNARVGGLIISILAYLATLFSMILAVFNPVAILITSVLATMVYAYSAYISRKLFVLYSAIISFGILYISAGCILVTTLKAEAFSWHPLNLALSAVALIPLSLIYLTIGYFLKRKKLNTFTPHIHYTGLLISIALMICSFADIEIARYVMLIYTIVLASLALLWQRKLFTYGACVALAASALCFSISFNPTIRRQIIADHALIIVLIASIFYLIGYLILRSIRHGDTQSERLTLFRALYGSPLIHSSMFLTAVSVVMAVLSELEWIGLICGMVITLNLLAYTLTHRHAFFVYAGCVSFLVTAIGLCYQLGFIDQATFVVAVYIYMLLITGYLLKRTKIDKSKTDNEPLNYKRFYAYPLVNSALAISILSLIGMFFFFGDHRYFSSASIAIFVSIFYLLAVKVYPRKLWIYPFQIFMTIGISVLTRGLTEPFSGSWIAFSPLIVFCILANLWVIAGLIIRNRKESICLRLRIPARDYDTPFFHWTTFMDSLAFLGIFILWIMQVFEEIAWEPFLICQILITSSLFFLLYWQFRRYHTVLLYISGLFVLWWTVPFSTKLSFLDYTLPYLITTSVSYAVLWYAFIRFKGRIRKMLGQIKLIFSEMDRSKLLQVTTILLYCNTGLTILLAFTKITAIYSIVAIFIAASIYFLLTFDKKHKLLSYTGIILSSLGCYAVLSAFLPIDNYGWDIAIPFGLLALGLTYFWEILGVWMIKRREGIGFFSKPCKWMGITFSAITFVFMILFTTSVAVDGATVLQASAEALIMVGVAIFYLWIAWIFQQVVFVYIGEALLVGMSVFLRIAEPQWFISGFMKQFWPIAIVGVSFVTVGLSYTLKKLKLLLYVRPSYYTSLILPIIPSIGAWFVGIETSIQTLLGAGIFYFLVSYVRRERRYGYIAVAVFNIAVQVLFIWQKIQFEVHPQIFVAPIGITLIGIAHLNRNQIDKKAIRILRSFASAIIYASSTIEFYTSETWVSPVILAGLCVLGILAGIALRIRPFLYLGTAFLLVDISVQIYNAGRINTWVWWISGVSFGLIILVLFALFERKRERALILLKELKNWD